MGIRYSSTHVSTHAVSKHLGYRTSGWIVKSDVAHERRSRRQRCKETPHGTGRHGLGKSAREVKGSPTQTLLPDFVGLISIWALRPSRRGVPSTLPNATKSSAKRMSSFLPR